MKIITPILLFLAPVILHCSEERSDLTQLTVKDPEDILYFGPNDKLITVKALYVDHNLIILFDSKYIHWWRLEGRIVSREKDLIDFEINDGNVRSYTSMFVFNDHSGMLKDEFRKLKEFKLLSFDIPEPEERNLHLVVDEMKFRFN